MAEARTGDEEERLRETRESGGCSRRNPRSSSAATERAERNKPEQRLSSQGALSSIRAAIKRTSTRTTPPDQSRDRRRPQITIVAAEPLASSSWFAGSSGAFPPAPPPPPAQPSWTGPVTVQLPPPSYDQVIREKTREQNTPTPSPSSSTSSTSSTLSSMPRTTATIATQTDPEPPDPQGLTKPPMRRPPKPPRPTFPFTPAPAEPAPAQTLIELDQPHPPCATQSPPHHPGIDFLSEPVSARCANQTDFAGHRTAALTPTPADSLATQTSPLECLMKQEVSARPRPRPRSKAFLKSVMKDQVQNQQMMRDVKVQTLVRLKDDTADSFYAKSGDASEVMTNKYMQELLDIFGGDEQICHGDQHCKSDQSQDEDDDTLESLFFPVSKESSEPLTRPEPRPRTQNLKPFVLPKPSHLTQAVQENKDSSDDSKQTPSPPAPAPRLLSKTFAPQQNGNKSEPSRLLPPPRPPAVSRRSGIPTKTEEPVQEDQAGKSNADDQDRISPLAPPKPTPIPTPARASQKCPAKPPSQRRPPPPMHTPTQDAVSAVSISKAAAASVPLLQPRPSEGRLLPLRPPPVKMTKSACSSQTPAPSNQLLGSGVPKRGPPLPPRPKPGHPLYRDQTSKETQGNAEADRFSTEPEEPHLQQKEDLLVVFDDGPTPTQTRSSTASQELKNQELKEEQQPEAKASVRYIARFEFQGEDGELKMREGDVITLIEYVNEEWGRGSLNGQIGIFPLNFAQEEASLRRSSTPESPAPPAGKGQTGKALYNFLPESKDELPLKAGDMVCNLEHVNEEWFVGECSGLRGIIPKNFIHLLQDPKAHS